jgi:hypothetical protein
MTIRHAIVTVALLWAFTGGVVTAQSSDFGFRFEVGDCLAERLDTFSGVFTKNLGGERSRIVTTELSLTDSQMQAIQQAIQRIRFFDYPSIYVGIPDGLKEVTTISPSTTYRLEVHSGETGHTVTWSDKSKPTTAEADQLRDLFSMIIGFIHEHPAFKRLERSSMGCE